MANPDLPDWSTNDKPFEVPTPDDTSPLTPSPDAIAPASPPAETQIKPPEDLVSVDDTGNVEDDVLPPPRVEDLEPASSEVPSRDVVPTTGAKGANTYSAADETGEPTPPPERPTTETDQGEADTIHEPASENGGGDGGSGEPPDGVSGEESDDSGEEETKDQVREKCRQSIGLIQRRLAESGDELSEPENRKLNNAYLTLAQTAGNIDAVKFQLDRMTTREPDETIKTYIVRLEAGDARAWDELHFHLWQERKSYHKALASSGTREPQANFDALMKLCEDQGVPVDEYIDTVANAAPTPEARAADRQHLFLQHASRVMPKGGEYAQSIQERVNDMAISMSEERLLEDAPYALVAVSDPEINAQLFNRYVDAYMPAVLLGDPTPENAAAAKRLFQVAPELAKSPGYAPTIGRGVSLLLDLDKSLALAAEDGLEQGFTVSEEQKERQREAARVDLTIRRVEAKILFNLHAEEPEDAAAVCRREADRTMSSQYKDGLFHTSEFAGELEAKCAQEYMRMGDIDGAQRFLESTKGIDPREMHTHVAVAHACWDAATTVEQMDALKPSWLLRDTYGSAHLEWTYKRTCLSTDAEEVAALAERFAREDLKVPGLGFTTTARAVGVLTERLAKLDPPAAQKLAGEMVKKLHSQKSDTDMSNLYSFYRVLLKSEDPAHLALMRQSITLAEGSDAAKLEALATLAYTLIHPPYKRS